MIFDMVVHTATSFEFIAGVVSMTGVYGTHRIIKKFDPKRSVTKTITVSPFDILWNEAYEKANNELKEIEPSAGNIPKKRFDIRYGYSGMSCGRQICALGFGHTGVCTY